MRTLGIVTIGQSPRDDMREEIRAAAGAPLRIVEAGALDRLDGRGIAALRPQGPDDVLVTRLRDGSQVTIGEAAVVPWLEGAIADVEKAGADVTLVVCTGSFPPLRHTRPLLFAGPLLTAGVAALARGMRVDIFCPDPRQVDITRAKWRAAGVVPVSVHAASPYVDAGRAVREAAGEVAAGEADVIVLDCMGYTEAMAAAVAAQTGIAAVPARRVAARMTGLLV